MKRTKAPSKKKPTAILTADWHIRESTPKCRMDDFWEAQWEKVDFISDLQTKYDCPVWFAGDLYNNWKPSPYLLSEGIFNFPSEFSAVFGNHDLPQHSLEQQIKCGMSTLYFADKINILGGAHWGMIPEEEMASFIIKHSNVLLWHVMTYPGNKPPWPGCEDLNAKEILQNYPEYDLIVTGHNHKTFVEEYEGRLLVNPGSLTRQTADQINHEPSVFLWYAESNTVEQIKLPFEKGVISREHIDPPEERKARLRAYVENMKMDWEQRPNFKTNLEIFFKKNKTSKKLRGIIWEAMES